VGKLAFTNPSFDHEKTRGAYTIQKHRKKGENRLLGVGGRQAVKSRRCETGEQKYGGRGEGLRSIRLAHKREGRGEQPGRRTKSLLECDASGNRRLREETNVRQTCRSFERKGEKRRNHQKNPSYLPTGRTEPSGRSPRKGEEVGGTKSLTPAASRSRRFARKKEGGEVQHR